MRFTVACVIAVISILPASAKKNRRIAKTEPVMMDVAAVNDATLPAPAGKRGPGILRAQILLSKWGFSAGVVDGSAGTNLERTVSGFQESRGLPVTGQIDEVTWKSLNEDTSPATVVYTITEEDVAGPYVKVPDDMMEQSKLESLGYESAEEKIAELFHTTPALLKRLNPDKSLMKAGEQVHVPHITRAAIAPAAEVRVSKSASTVRAIGADGKIIRQYVATIGSENDPLPIGEWKVTGVFRNPKFHYNPKLFWDADPSHSKATIAPGPNNPVGTVWIDLTKEHYGIHGTPNPATVGHTQSHGCIRLTNWDVLELAAMVEKGTLVVMHE